MNIPEIKFFNKIINDNKFIKPKEASSIIGVNIDTLRRIVEIVDIKHIRTDTDRVLFFIFLKYKKIIYFF